VERSTSTEPTNPVALPIGYTLRPVRDSDSRDLQELHGRCFAEYPGCVLDTEGEEPALLTPTTSFEVMWVLEHEGHVVGCIAAKSHPEYDPPHAELKKLYVLPSHQGRGLARVLVETMESYARARGFTRVELWSDTRFTKAHAVYTHLGYAPTGRSRELFDLSHTAEFHFVRESV